MNVGFEIPIFRMGSRMFLKSGEVSGSSVSCPAQNPAKVTVKSRNETMGVIFEDSAVPFGSQSQTNASFWWTTDHDFCQMLVSCQIFVTVIQLSLSTETTKGCASFIHLP